VRQDLDTRPLFELNWLMIVKGSRRIDSKVACEMIVVRICTSCGQPELGRRQLAASYSLLWVDVQLGILPAVSPG